MRVPRRRGLDENRFFASRVFACFNRAGNNLEFSFVAFISDIVRYLCLIKISGRQTNLECECFMIRQVYGITLVPTLVWCCAIIWQNTAILSATSTCTV